MAPRKKPTGHGDNAKKSRSNAKKNGKADTEKEPGDGTQRTARPPHINELAIDHTPTFSNRRRGIREIDTLESLREELRAFQDTQSEERETFLDHQRRWYDLEAATAATRLVYDEEMKTEKNEKKPRGKSQPVKDAKARWVQAKDAESAVKTTGHEYFMSSDRRNAANADWKLTQGKLEDLLYYQSEDRRRLRLRVFDPIKRAEDEAKRMGRKLAYKFAADGDDYYAFDWLHTLLEYYDTRHIGGARYAQGEIDRLGNQIIASDRVMPPRLRPEDLHLWTPVYRRGTVGLRLRKIGEDTDIEEGEYDYGPGTDPIQTAFDLDLPAIEEARRKFDNKPKHEDDDSSVAENHNARRAAQIETYKDTRPNTSNIHLRETGAGMITEDRWREIQTTEGLFLAVKESSWDWLTSYDCLDKIARSEINIIAPTSAIRGEPPFGPWDDRDDPDDDEHMVWRRNYPQGLDEDPPDDDPVEIAEQTGKDTKKVAKAAKGGKKVAKGGKGGNVGENVEQAGKDSKKRPRDTGTLKTRSSTRNRTPAAGKGSSAGADNDSDIVSGEEGNERAMKKTKLGMRADISPRRSPRTSRKPTPELGTVERTMSTSVSESTAEDDAAAELLLELMERKRLRKRRANIDYPYPRREFALEKKDHPPALKATLNDTPWMEETDGRREWHAYRHLSPSSDVDSPPRTPIQENGIDESTLPQDGSSADATSFGSMWQISADDSSRFSLEANKRRCPTANCRAWWQHPPQSEECWIVDSKIARGDEDPDIRPVEAPLHMAASGQRIYRARLEDHFGLRQPPDQEARWPKLGIRVPYGPMAFDSMKLNREAAKGSADDANPDINGTALPDDDADGLVSSHAQDARQRHAYEFHSMTVPIIKEPQRPWGRVDADPPVGASDDESDDSGDIFHTSYNDGPLVGPATPSNPSSDDPTNE